MTMDAPAGRYLAPPMYPSSGSVKQVAAILKKAQKPVLVIGSQAMLSHGHVSAGGGCGKYPSGKREEHRLPLTFCCCPYPY